MNHPNLWRCIDFSLRDSASEKRGLFDLNLRLAEAKSTSKPEIFSCPGNGILGPFLHGISTKRDSKCDEAAHKSRGHELLEYIKKFGIPKTQ